MKFKRIAAFLLSLVIVFGVVGCGETKTPTKKPNTDKNKTESQIDSSVDDTASEDNEVIPESQVSTPSEKSNQSQTDISSTESSTGEINWDEFINAGGSDTTAVIKGQQTLVTGESARVSSAKISNLNAKQKGKIKSERVQVYGYNENWSFNHAPFIVMHKGKLHLIWGQGHANEDDLGQRIAYAVSSDFKNWKVSILSDSMPGTQTLGGKVMTSAQQMQWPKGFFTNGENLVVYYSANEYKLESLRDNYTLRPLTYDFAKNTGYYRELKANGSWSEPKLVTRLQGGNHSVIKLKSGRYVFAGSTSIMYSDDASGFGAWSVGGMNLKTSEDAVGRGATNLCEAACYETDDGVLHLLMRSDTPVLWQTQSYDGGVSWTNAYPTNFSNDSSKFDVGRLPDGRYFIVSNTVVGSKRLPLTISLSKDGYSFTEEYIIRDEPYTVRKPGLDKGGAYGYPTCTMDNKYLYISYSIGKEVIEVTRIKLSDL